MGTKRQYLTIEEFCEEFDIKPSTFHDWCAKRRAPRRFKLPNGRIRIDRADVDAWLKAREVAA